MGFKTFKIKVQDFIKLEDKIITLVEDVVSLDEITLVNYNSFVKYALKNLKNTTQTKGHQLNILYRRFSNENGLSRFLVEHYLKVYDRGPTSEKFDQIEIVESRKSNDYRFVKKKQKFHAAVMIAKQIKEYLENGNIINSVNFPDAKMPRAGQERLAITHRNVPNMVRQITKAIAEEEANIVDMLNKSKGEFAYTLIDIEEKIPNSVIDNIKKVEGILKVRAL